MCENGGELSLACLLERLTANVGLAAEGWEFGNGLEEVVVGIDGVALRETSIPVCLAKD